MFNENGDYGTDINQDVPKKLYNDHIATKYKKELKSKFVSPCCSQ